MPKLLIINGEKKNTVFTLPDQEITIGRSPESTIVLPDQRISRVHARIRPDNKDFVIEDAGSVNGTKVNDVSVVKQTLRFGDTILLGATSLRFLPLTAPETDGGSPSSYSNIVISDDRERSAFTIKEKMEASDASAVSGEKIAAADFPQAYQRLAVLYKISKDLETLVNLKDLLDHVAVLVRDTIRADRSLIFLKDEESGELVLHAVKSKDGFADGEQVVVSKTIANQVMKTGESVLTTDAMQDERFKEAQSVVREGIHSTMCVPIKTEEEVLGLIHVDSKGQDVHFQKDDLELLTAVANQVSVAVRNAKLFEDLKRANQELKARQRQLIEAEKLSALGQLAGGVAHEINNPMTSILGYSQLSITQLSEDASAGKVKECLEFLKIIESEAHRCQSIVQGLLQFGRRQKEEMAPTNVNQVIDAALMIAKFHIKKSGVEIVKDLDGKVPEVPADKNQLQQVFLNLIINARDAMEDKGRLEISSRLEEEWIVLRFKDNGCGIPKDKMEEIFKPLYTTKEEGKGTGLGLSITQDIIDRHHGSIEVDSTIGKGTTFTIKLPAAQEQKS